MKLVFPGGEHPHVLLGHGISRIGSDPSSTIVLDAPGLQPQLCQLQVNAHGVVLDAPAGAAVTVNGRAAAGLISLRDGDVVGFAGVQARLAANEPVAPAPPTALHHHYAGERQPASANDDPGATAIRPVLPRYVLRGVGEAFGHNFPVPGVATIGRAPDCQLRLDHNGLSRHHARVIPTEQGLQIEDLGSTNGSYINNQRVVRDEARVGDEVGFDTLRFRLVGPRTQDPDEEAGAPRRRLPHWLSVAAWVAAIAAIAVAVFWMR